MGSARQWTAQYPRLLRTLHRGRSDRSLDLSGSQSAVRDPQGDFQSGQSHRSVSRTGEPVSLHLYPASCAVQLAYGFVHHTCAGSPEPVCSPFELYGREGAAGQYRGEDRVRKQARPQSAAYEPTEPRAIYSRTVHYREYGFTAHLPSRDLRQHPGGGGHLALDLSRSSNVGKQAPESWRHGDRKLYIRQVPGLLLGHEPRPVSPGSLQHARGPVTVGRRPDAGFQQLVFLRGSCLEGAEGFRGKSARWLDGVGHDYH